MQRLTFLSRLTCTVLLAPGFAWGQAPFQTWSPATPDLPDFSKFARAGDLDGDGFEDVLIESFAWPDSTVAAYSGRSGSLIYDVTQAPAGWMGGMRSVGDLNGDSVPDFALGFPNELVSATSSGRVRMFSGLDGTLLYTANATDGMYYLGTDIRPLGDLNGDGKNEWMARTGDLAGLFYRMSVHAGSDGSKLYSVDMHYGAGDFLALIGLPDQDLDGTPDYAMNRAIQGGILELYSGATGQLISQVPTGPIYSADSIGDMDGDGQDDLLLGHPGTFDSNGRVWVLSTSTWDVLLDIPMDASADDLGTSVAGLKDLSGDGVPDILTSGSLYAPKGTVRIFSGQDGSVLRAFDDDNPNSPLGRTIDSAGDANGDGLGDYFLFNGTDPLRVELYLGGEDLGSVLCTPSVPNSVGELATLEAIGSAQAADNQVTLQSLGLPTGQPGMFLNSQMTGMVVPGGSQGTLCLGGAIGRYNQPVLTTGANGSTHLNLDLSMTPRPTGPVQVLAGETWYFQFWYRDVFFAGGTSNFSSALGVQFQ